MEQNEDGYLEEMTGSYLGQIRLISIGKCPPRLYIGHLGIIYKIGHSLDQEVRLGSEVSIEDGDERVVSQPLEPLQGIGEVIGQLQRMLV